MPLKPGSDEKTIQENIEELVKANFAQNQAVAIAEQKAHPRERKPTKKKKKRTT
jgi:hypothetical protein